MSSQFKTRPALMTRMGQQSGDSPLQLRLTVVFHPDLQRIGTYTDLAPWPESASGPLGRSMTIGRSQPVFGDGRGLDDPHVSRHAFELRRTGVGEASTLRIAAGPTSTCRLGVQQAAQLVVDQAELEIGIPIRLGHGVVLYLRLVNALPSTVSTERFARHLLGCSAEMERLRLHLAAVAATDLPVLILGQSGVGKEVVARAIHECSSRANGPMVTVNTAAFTESLSGAELFGNTRTAFTGAAARKGYFEEANNGTLFLDEIGDAHDGVQVQLLRALEQGEIQVLGGGIKKVNVRVIAATDASVSFESGFRHALLTRLSGHTVTIPPLGSRREDIGPQAIGFLRSDTNNGSLSDYPFPIEACPNDEYIAAHWAKFFFEGLSQPWSGNSRELRNAVIRAANSDPEVAPALERSHAVDESSAHELALTDDELERVHDEHDFEIAATARALGLSRQAVYRRIKAHPNLWLIDDLSDAQIKEEIASGGTMKAVARRLRVSEPSLKQRLRNLKVG